MAVGGSTDARRRLRAEDPRLLTGRGAYVANIARARVATMKVVRSPHARARIRSVDVEAARRAAGVLAVWTGDDVAAWPMPVVSMFAHLPRPAPLAAGEVHYVGHAVAVVVATDAYRAADAADLVDVDYEPLRPMLDIDIDAASASAEHVAYVIPSGPRVEFGDGDVVVRARIVNQRLMPSPMEMRGVLADWSPVEDRLTVHLSTQAPHTVRTKLAEALQLAEGRVRIIAGDVGGAFGSKFGLFVEEVLASLLSRHLGVPVRWIEERTESATSSTHGRAIVADVELAAAPAGDLTGLHVRAVGDLGGHLGIGPPVGPFLVCQMMSGPYRIPAISFEAVGVFTNRTPVDPYRGYYRAEATYVLERAIELLARQLAMDPVELRRRNLIAAEAMPYTTATGEVYDNGDYAAALETVLGAIDHDGVRGEQARRRAAGDGRALGVGVTTFVWRSSFPSMPDPNPNLEFIVGGWEATTVRVERTGGVTVATGASPHGQGLGNALAAIVGEQLGIDPADVVVRSGDTDAAPYGMGSAGSRALVTAGSAAFVAAERVRDKAIALAAHLLEAAPADLEWEGRRVQVKGTPAKSFDLYDLAKLANQGVRPPGMEPGLEAQAAFDPSNFVYPYGAHACVVEVDTDTGAVTVVRYVAVDDCGRLVNPMIVEGQVHGALAQGIGQALSEEAGYDDDGQPLNASFAQYGILGAPQLPWFETVPLETPTSRNPLGAKGAGEAGTIGAPPTVVNAVLDALAPYGIRHLDTPLVPERVWSAIHRR